jgi:hypothetical protein
MIRLNDETVILVFQLQSFRTVDHKYVRELLIEEILQTIQIIIIIKIKPTIPILAKKPRTTRAASAEPPSYSPEWAVDKAVFREACSHFWMAISTESASSESKILQKLQETRLRNRQEAVDAVSFANVKVKILHDKRHKPLFLKSGEKAFLRLHKEYNLSEIINKKLSQQRCDSFTIKRRVSRLVYELDLFKK